MTTKYTISGFAIPTEAVVLGRFLSLAERRLALSRDLDSANQMQIKPTLTGYH